MKSFNIMFLWVALHYVPLLENRYMYGNCGMYSLNLYDYNGLYAFICCSNVHFMGEIRLIRCQCKAFKGHWRRDTYGGHERLAAFVSEYFEKCSFLFTGYFQSGRVE